MGLFTAFYFLIDKITLTEVKIFTVICFIILGGDILLNLVVIGTRLKGLCRPGMRYPYVRMNEDYVELQAGGRNVNTWLNSGQDNLS